MAQAGDVITGVNSQGVASPQDVTGVLAKLEGGSRKDVDVRVVRNRKPVRLRVDLTWGPEAALPKVHSVNQR